MEIELSPEKPQLTVGLPLYRARWIAWLGLESLYRQDNRGIPWELVVAEEEEPLAVGADAVLSYSALLAKAGCTRIVYQALQDWIPLGDKWSLLASLSHPDSKYFVFQPADRYSPRQRLRETLELFEKGADWVHTYCRFIYNIASERVALLDQRHELRKGVPSGVDPACILSLLRNAKPSGKRVGVDKWLRQVVEIAKGSELCYGDNTRKSWRCGLSTVGLNNITRFKDITQLKPPAQVKVTRSLEWLCEIPNNVLFQLFDLKEVAGEWKRRPWRSTS